MADQPLDHTEKAHLPESAPPTNHGHTLAAWVTVSLVMLGAVVSAAGVLASQMWLFWTGLGIVVVAAVVGRVLKSLGHGQSEPSGPHRTDDAAGRDIA